MPKDLTLAVRISGQLSSSFRAAMDAAGKRLSGLRKGVEDVRGVYAKTDATLLRHVRRQEEIRKNEEAVNRLLRGGNALAEQRSRIYGDLARLSLQAAALLAPMGMAVSAAAAKQDTIRDMAITGGMNAADEAALSLAVRDIAGQSNQMQTDVLAGMQVLVAGGVQSRAELEAYGRELSRVATATRASMDDLGATTLALRDNLGITAQDLGASFNILASAGKAGLVELKDMAKFLPQMAPTLASMGVTGNEAVAEIAAALQIARRGAGSNDEAATNMRNYLQKIFAPDTVKNFADAGIDLKGSLQQLAKDGIGPFEGSVMLAMEYLRSQSPAAAAEFQRAMQVKDDAERAQMLSRISEAYALSDLFRDMQAMNFLRPMAMQMEDYRQIKDESLGAAKADVIGQDFDKRMESPVERWKAMRVEAERLTESLGNALLPSALALGDTLLPMLSSLADWISANQELVVTLAKGAALVLGFRAGLLGLRLGFNLFISPLAGAGVKMLAFRTMTKAGLGPVQALLRIFGMSPKAASLFTVSLAKAGKTSLSLGRALRGGLGRSILSVFGMGEKGQGPGGGMSKAFSGVAKAVGNQFSKIGPALRDMGKASLSLGKALGGGLVKGFQAAGKAVLFLGRALMLNPIGLIVTAVGVAAVLIYQNWDKIKNAFAAAWNWLKTMGPKFLKQGLEIASKILPGVAAAKYIYENWETIKAAIGKGIDWILGLPARFLQMGKDIALGLVNGIREGIGAAAAAIAGMAEGVKNTFADWLGISSPSKLFVEYGLNVAQGAALGIRSGEAAAGSASASLAAATAGAWQAPRLLTDSDGPARIGAAPAGGGMNITFSPAVTIQGNADAGAVREGLTLTLEDLKRMLARIAHEKDRRAYV